MGFFSSLGFSVYGIFQERILEWVVIFLLQGIFPNQGSNPHLLCLLHRRWILYLLNHQGSQNPFPFTCKHMAGLHFPASLAVRWRRQWHPTPVLLPGKSHGQRSLVAAVHGVAKSRTRLSDFTFTFHFHALEKAMATHSSVLAWGIPGMGEPGGLLSMGSHRVGHD